MLPSRSRDDVRPQGPGAPPRRVLGLVAGALCALAGCASSTDSLGADKPANAFEEVLDVTPEEVADKLAAAYEQLFHSEDTEAESILVDDAGGGAYVVSVSDGAIKTDGLGYALFLAVMLDHQDDFDALWTYARDNLRYATGARSNLLYWVCAGAECPDPNGMTYAATALIFADHRWGEGEHDYAADSRALRRAMLHKEDGGIVDDVRNCFDAETNLVKNSPIGDIRFTTPGFMLPAFYEIW
ncbi:MAG TPA: glycosyl hydrolase family 8, partial [Polyangiaceae bacterium]|nr:glycosyl hydrolase family 8 [Polyangiaceae bacterium]